MQTTLHTRHKRLGGLASLILLVVLALASVPRGAAAAVVYPNSIASTGDSITRGFNTGPLVFTDAPENSWSTGTSLSVNSIYNRLTLYNPMILGHNYNDAKTGAKMVDLAGQIATVNAQHVDYVTILMGANDVCTSSESGMTSVQTYHDQFLAAMNSLAQSSPGTRVYVLSVPNVYNLWSILKGNSTARFVWSLYGICQSMLANPLSTTQSDIDRRNRVRQRNIDFNTQLQQVCAQFAQCRFDNNAIFNTAFVTSDVSTRDYFHPSTAGQAKLASVAWAASGLAP